MASTQVAIQRWEARWSIFAKESLVSVIRRVSRVGVMVVMAVMATGCIVLPFGHGHGRYGANDRHYAPTGERQWSGSESTREAPERRGR